MLASIPTNSKRPKSNQRNASSRVLLQAKQLKFLCSTSHVLGITIKPSIPSPKNHIIIMVSSEKLQIEFPIEKEISRISICCRASSPSGQLLGNFLGYSSTSRDRPRVANTRKVGSLKDATIVTFKQFLNEPMCLPRD